MTKQEIKVQAKMKADIKDNQAPAAENQIDNTPYFTNKNRQIENWSCKQVSQRESSTWELV